MSNRVYDSSDGKIGTWSQDYDNYRLTHQDFTDAYGIDFSSHFDLSPFEGTNYYDVVSDLINRQYSYSMSPTDRLRFNMTGRSGIQDYAEQLYQDISMKYNDYLGKLGDIKENSPVTKDAKMVAAGQNPDLLGTEGVSDAPGIPADEQQAQPPASYSTAFFQSIGEGLQMGISLAMSGIQFTQGMQSIRNANLEMSSKARDYAFKLATSWEHVNGYADYGTPLKYYFGGDGNAVGSPSFIRRFARRHGMSYRDAKEVYNWLENYSPTSVDVAEAVSSKRKNVAENVRDTGKAKSEPYYDDVTAVVDSIANNLQETNTIILEYNKSAELNNAANEYSASAARIDYQDARNHNTFSPHDTEGGLRGKLQLRYKDMENILTKESENVLLDLQDLADDGNEIAPYVLMALNLIYITKSTGMFSGFGSGLLGKLAGLRK